MNCITIRILRKMVFELVNNSSESNLNYLQAMILRDNWILKEVKCISKSANG